MVCAGRPADGGGSPLVLLEATTRSLTLDRENVGTRILIAIGLQDRVDSSLVLRQIHINIKSFVHFASGTWASRSPISPRAPILTSRVVSLLHGLCLVAGSGIIIAVIHVLLLDFLSVSVVGVWIHSWLIRVTISFTIRLTHSLVIIIVFAVVFLSWAIILSHFRWFWLDLELCFLLGRPALILRHFTSINAAILGNQLGNCARV